MVLLRGFSSVFRAPFSNICLGLRWVVKDIEDNTSFQLTKEAVSPKSPGIYTSHIVE